MWSAINLRILSISMISSPPDGIEGITSFATGAIGAGVATGVIIAGVGVL